MSDGKYWDTKREREKVRNNPNYGDQFFPYLYRPFDIRWIYYQPNLIEIGRGGAGKRIMRHMLAGQNVGLIITRQTRDKWDVLATKCICTHKSCAAYDTNSLFVLYLYPDFSELDFHNTRRPNLRPTFLKALAEKL